MSLLPDRTEWAPLTEAVRATYRASGPGVAMAQFMKIAGLNSPARPAGDAPSSGPPSPELQQTFARIGSNLPFFFEHGMVPLSDYVPDIDALSNGPAHVVAGAAELTAGSAPHRAALALADALGVAAVTFPGDHGGYSLAVPFAAKLREVYSTT